MEKSYPSSAIKKVQEFLPNRVVTAANDVPVQNQSQNLVKLKQQNQKKIHQKVTAKMNLGNQLTDRQKTMKKPSAVVAEIAAENANTEAAVVMTTDVKEVGAMVDEAGALSVILHQGTGMTGVHPSRTPPLAAADVQCMKDCRKSHLNALIDPNQG